MKTAETKFKIDVEYDDKLMDGRECQVRKRENISGLSILTEMPVWRPFWYRDLLFINRYYHFISHMPNFQLLHLNLIIYS